MVRLLTGSAVALCLVSPVMAGPCTQKIADLEKSISAKQEGAGPTLTAPATTSSTTSGSSSTQKVEQPSGTGTVQTQGSSEAMNMLKQAKEFDQQGKEAECMQITARVSSMAPPATK